MPLAHNLNKVTKNLSKAKGAMHIKGRKFKQLNRATLRDKKLTDKRMKTLIQKEKDNGIVFFLQKLINDDDDYKVQQQFDLQEIKGFIEIYLSRHDEELEELISSRRPGRPLTPRHQLLEEKAKHEKHVYSTGMKVPDLTDKVTVELLKVWNGTSGALTTIKFIHVSESMDQLPTKEIEMA